MRWALPILMLACGGEDRHPITPPAADPPPTASASPDVQPVTSSKPAPECTGAEIDVAKALASTGCQAGVGTTIDALNRLKISVAPPPKVAPGAKADIGVTLTNDSDAPVQLRLLPMPWPAITKTTMGPNPCGTKVHLEETASSLRAAPTSSGPAAQIVIPPRGVARAAIAWEATGQKWSKDCKPEPAPLAPGSYNVAVRVPAVGISIPEQEIAIAVAK